MQTALYPHTMNEESRRLRLLQREIQSLESEGYRQLFAAQTMGCKVFVKMRHLTNGNTMHITLQNNTVTLTKNGKQIKQYEI